MSITPDERNILRHMRGKEYKRRFLALFQERNASRKLWDDLSQLIPYLSRSENGAMTEQIDKAIVRQVKSNRC